MDISKTVIFDQQRGPVMLSVTRTVLCWLAKVSDLIVYGKNNGKKQKHNTILLGVQALKEDFFFLHRVEILTHSFHQDY